MNGQLTMDNGQLTMHNCIRGMYKLRITDNVLLGIDGKQNCQLSIVHCQLKS